MAALVGAWGFYRLGKPVWGLVTEAVLLLVGVGWLERQGAQHDPEAVAQAALKTCRFTPTGPDVEYVIKRLETEEALALGILDALLTKSPLNPVVLILVALVSLDVVPLLWPPAATVLTQANHNDVGITLFLLGFVLLGLSLFPLAERNFRRQRTQVARTLREQLRDAEGS